MCRKILWLVLLALLFGSVTVQGAEVEWIRAAYWDARYATGWLNAAASTAIRDDLAAAGYEILDADQLKTWMDARIADGKYSVVVFCRDRVPDTVIETTDTNCTLRTYLNKGGKIVWISDIPFYYRVAADGTSTTTGDAGAPAVLGFNTAGATRDTRQTVTLTPIGMRWGLTQTWQSRRPALPNVTTNLTILATDNAGNAAAWVKPYVAGDKFRGFVRIWDVDVTATSRPAVEEIIRVAEFVGAKAWPESPADGEKAWTTPMLRWQSGLLSVKQHIVYIGTTPELTEADRFGAPLPVARNYTLYPMLEAGTTYYWRVDEIASDNTVYVGDVWSFSTPPAKAWGEKPADGTTFVDPAVTLEWQPGMNAVTRDIYFGTDRAAVEAGAPETKKVTDEWGTSYAPAALELGVTYYWRVDEVIDGSRMPGDVWSFTVRPVMAKVDPTLVGWWKLEDENAGVAVDYSGWDNYGTLQNGPQWAQGWFGDALAFDGVDDYVDCGNDASLNNVESVTVAAWIKPARVAADLKIAGNQDGANGGYKLGMYSANSKVEFEIRTATNAYFLNRDVAGGTVLQADRWYHVVGVYNKGQSIRTYVNGQLDREMATTEVVGVSAGTLKIGREPYSGGYFWHGLLDDVRIYNRVLSDEEIAQLMLRSTRYQAYDPQPARYAQVDIRDVTGLSWLPGDSAAKHDVYFGFDRQAVKTVGAGAPPFMGQQTGTSFSLAGLVQIGSGDCFWRIDEVEANGAVHEGDVWKFTIPDGLLVDTFEDYNEDYANLGCVYQSWVDGGGFTTPVNTPGNGSGALVGYPTWDETSTHYNLTTVETGITIPGSHQSMPLYYYNRDPATGYYSEAARTWTTPEDWTGYGVTDLSLWVYGYPAPRSIAVAESAGKIALTSDGSDIWNNSDDFTFAYKTLSGDGMMAARVVSNGTGTSTWTKGGVMIRQSLNGGSTHAMMVVTAGGGNGANFQWRQTADRGSANTDPTGVVAPPYWVKIERFTDTLTGSISPDGVSWSLVGTVQIPMSGSVYIGLCTSSGVANVDRTFEFDNISSGATVTGQWQGAIIEQPLHNSPAVTYVTLQDSLGNSATVPDPNTAKVTIAGWRQWKYPLSAFGAVDKARIKKMVIGVGDKSPDGSGLLLIDDIRVTKPEEQTVGQ